MRPAAARPSVLILHCLTLLLTSAGLSLDVAADGTDPDWGVYEPQPWELMGRNGSVVPAVIVQVDPLALDAVFSAVANLYTESDARRALTLPSPDGRLVQFHLMEVPTLSPFLQDRRPNLRTYAGMQVGDSRTRVRITRSETGLHAWVLGIDGWTVDSWVTDSPERAAVWWNRDDPSSGASRCWVEEGNEESVEIDQNALLPKLRGSELVTYDLAVSGSGEFTQYHGSISNAEAQIVTLVNNANAFFERDLAVRMQIVDLNVYSDPGTDPFTNGTVPSPTTLQENHDALIAKLGFNGFDLGHMVGLNSEGGWQGRAGVGVQCDRFGQGLGATVASPPSAGALLEGILHEMGHQLGARHSFNGSAGACGSNRAASWAYEIASGVSIMGYAGICGAEDVVSQRILFYDAGSVESITNEIINSGNCGGVTDTGNAPPTAEAGPDVTIPRETAFLLDASASFDPDGDPLTYSWEQHDLGPASPPYGPELGPLFRNFEPGDDPLRSVPLYAAYVRSLQSSYEFLPSVDRVLTFRLVVRDERAGGGGLDWDTRVLTVAGEPFEILFPNGGESIEAGQPLDLSWQVGGGSVASEVRILVSTDSGTSWTELESATPNDGLHRLAMTCMAGETTRLRLEPVGNIFFDISDADFTVSPDVTPPDVTCPGPLTVEATSPSGIDKDDPALLEWLSTTVTADACDSAPTLQLLTQQTIPVGTTTVGISAVDGSGNFGICTSEVTVVSPVASPSNALVTGILNAHPNPFNPRTTIQFRLGSTQRCRLEILNLAGRRVAVLHEGILERGDHDTSWNASGAASGVYVARLETEDGVYRRRIVLLK